MIAGEMDRGDDPKMKVSEVYPLEMAPQLFAKGVHIHMPEQMATDKILKQLKELFIQNPGNTQATICLVFETGKKVFMNTSGSYRVRADGVFVHAVNHILGENSVYVDIVQNACLTENTRKRRWNGKGAQ